MKFEIFRADLNKVLARDINAADAHEAFGIYASALMVGGMVSMSDDYATEDLGGNQFAVKTVAGKRFTVEVRAL